MTRPRPRRGSLLLLPALVLLLAACTGATAAPSGVASLEDPVATADPAASPSASISPEDAMFEFARCMREHGVDMPDPQVMTGSGGERGAVRVDLGDVDPADFQAAQEACGPILQDAGMGPGASMSPEELDAFVAFAECMREQGIDMPDPQTSQGGGLIIGGGPGSEGGIDPSDPEFQAAEEACNDLLPFRGGGADGGPGTNVNGG